MKKTFLILFFIFTVFSTSGCINVEPLPSEPSIPTPEVSYEKEFQDTFDILDIMMTCTSLWDSRLYLSFYWNKYYSKDYVLYPTTGIIKYSDQILYDAVKLDAILTICCETMGYSPTSTNKFVWLFGETLISWIPYHIAIVEGYEDLIDMYISQLNELFKDLPSSDSRYSLLLSLFTNLKAHYNYMETPGFTFDNYQLQRAIYKDTNESLLNSLSYYFPEALD